MIVIVLHLYFNIQKKKKTQWDISRITWYPLKGTPWRIHFIAHWTNPEYTFSYSIKYLHETYHWSILFKTKHLAHKIECHYFTVQKNFLSCNRPRLLIGLPGRTSVPWTTLWQEWLLLPVLETVSFRSLFFLSASATASVASYWTVT